MIPLFVLAHFCHHMVPALLVPLLPFIRNDFGLDYTRSGFLISAFTLSNGFSQLLGGYLADRVDPRIMITVAISGVAFFGLLASLSQAYLVMIGLFVLMGVAGGGYHPGTPPLISASVNPKNQGLALGFHVIGGTASYFLSPLIGAAITLYFGWRGAFMTLGVPAFLFGLCFYVLLGKRQYRITKQGGKTGDPGDTDSRPARMKRLVAFMVLTTFTQAVVFSTHSFIPLFIVDHFRVDRQIAAVLTTLVAAAGFWASPLGGYLADRFGGLPVMLGLCIVSGPLIYLLNFVPYGFMFIAFLLVFGTIIIMRMPVSEIFILGNTPAHLRSTVLGIYYFSGMEGGGLLTPALGYLIDRFGFTFSFTMTGASLLVMTAICSLFLFDRRK